MTPWTRLSETENQKVGYRDIVIKKFKMPDGRVEDYGILDKEKTAFVAIIGLTTRNTVVIAKQFRPGPELILDELPGGMADPGEDPETGALRELLEETGYQPKKVEYLGIVRKEAYRNGVHHYFLGYDSEKIQEPTLEENEFIQTIEISIEKLIKNATSGNMTDIGAVFLAYEKLRSILLQSSNRVQP